VAMTDTDDWWDRVELPHSFQVEDRPAAINTGLLDKDGNPIYRDRPRVGFVTDFSKPRIRVKAVTR
jgi:hypothetical protein